VGEAVRLVDLEPRWLVKDGQRIGFAFRCPTRRDNWQTCFVAAPSFRDQCRVIGDAFDFDSEEYEDGRPDIQSCKEGACWSIAGGIDDADFATLTVTPSLDGSPGGNWHGFITNGEIVGGI